MSARFTVGGVLSLGLRTWLRGAVRFLVIPLLLWVPGVVWFAVVGDTTMRALDRYLARQHAVVSNVVGGRYVLIAMGFAAIAHSVPDALAGRPPLIGSALKASVRRFVPVVGIAVLSMALISLWAELVDAIDPSWWRQGWPYIVLGAFTSIVRTLLYLAIPIAVLERRGLFASVLRGLALTRGARLRVWAIAALMLVIAWAGGQLLFFALAPDLRQLRGDARANALVPYGCAVFAFTLLWISVSAVINAVAYRMLRDAKEGPPPEELANVFA
jgi:hypothetical protein